MCIPIPNSHYLQKIIASVLFLYEYIFECNFIQLLLEFIYKAWNVNVLKCLILKITT